MDNELRITDPHIASVLLTLGIPMLERRYEETVYFIFPKTLDNQNIVTLYNRNYEILRSGLKDIRITNKLKKAKIDEDPRFKDLRSEYRKSTQRIKGAPTSKSNGVYRQY